MANTPTAVANLALDAAGVNIQLGNIAQGGREANIVLRAYGECLRQLLRGAPWGFARRQLPLVLLADATGTTANVGTIVPDPQFIYSYRMPPDAARIRYIPWYPGANPGAPAGNITPPNPSLPLVGGLTLSPLAGMRPRPSLFLITNDPNAAAPLDSNFASLPGQSPVGSSVICSNVQDATCVYTFNATYPSLWDHLFLGAMVSYLASEVCIPLWTSKNPKMAMMLRKDQVEIAKARVREARVADGNEMTASSDIPVDWMQFRQTGGGMDGASSGGDYGCWGSRWSGSLLFGGTAY